MSALGVKTDLPPRIYNNGEQQFCPPKIAFPLSRQCSQVPSFDNLLQYIPRGFLLGPSSKLEKEAALPLEAIYSPKANNLKNYTPFEGDVFAQKITSILGIFTVQYKKAVITSFYLGTMN